ncbi:TolB family protein [Pseudoalteromonas sp. S16_S37]|uniref:TolB family protein n=1 Tax=Pseudoalteromonas sp. S16_S37 TaxID=2720228 RepID=UPI001680B1C9|nr:PD40 domain-containing protein [Pseudoalteromonas sp. S16_S37]MBD1581297.1 hypothetical protein [Pseudoalteromonas sp. S16_S37]
MKCLLLLLAIICSPLTVYAQIVEALSSDKSDYNLNFHPKYNRVVLARSDNHFSNAKVIQYSRSNEGEFTHPIELKLGPNQFKYTDPMYAPNGKHLYFVTDRPLNGDATSRHLNLWQATLKQGLAQDIAPLLMHINLDNDALGPERHNDKLFFTQIENGQYKIMVNNESAKKTEPFNSIPIDKHVTARSDITFSPDGKVAVFWQTTKSSNHADLYASRHHKGKWSAPIKLKGDVNSAHHEITPQFSVDAKWLYYSSNRPEPGYALFNIHKVSTKSAFPDNWYQAHFAPKKLNLLSHHSSVKDITAFSYTVTLEINGTKSSERVYVRYQPFRLTSVRQGVRYEINAKSGEKINLSNHTTERLSTSEVKNEIKRLRQNFIDLLKQPQTKLYRQYSYEPSQFIYRIEAPLVEPFSILVDEKRKKILKLFYDDGGVGHEMDYRAVKGILWPFKFTYQQDGKTIASGEFSNLCISYSSDKANAQKGECSIE